MTFIDPKSCGLRNVEGANSCLKGCGSGIVGCIGAHLVREGSCSTSRFGTFEVLRLMAKRNE